MPSQCLGAHAKGTPKTLTAAGDALGLAYMGSRELALLAENGLILPVSLSDEAVAAYQPGVLATVSNGDQYWGLTPILQYEKLGFEDLFYTGDPF